jgi:hypothetical protein
MLIVGKMWGLSEAPVLAENANILGQEFRPRGPAWENGPCFVFSNITAQGVDSGYGKRQQNSIPFRLAC